MGQFVGQFTVDSKRDGSGLRNSEGNVNFACRENPRVVTFRSANHKVANCSDGIYQDFLDIPAPGPGDRPALRVAPGLFG